MADGIKLGSEKALIIFNELHKLKEAHRRQDVEGEDYRLHYVRNKDGQEIDFLVTRANKPERLIEVKWADSSLSPYFKKFFPRDQLKRVQVVGELKQSKSYPSAERIEPATRFLSKLSLGTTMCS